MSTIIDFYDGVGTDSEGRTLEYILSQNLEWMEYNHDFIQWVFPLKKPSNFNADAPLLTDEDIKLFMKSSTRVDNLMSAVTKFLYFLGIEQTLGPYNRPSKTPLDKAYFAEGRTFDKQKYTWFEFNHNSLRITRLLKFMVLLGLNQFAADLLEFMKQTADQHKVKLNETALSYWEKAVKA